MNRTNTTMLTTFRLPAPHEATITFPSDEIELEDSARIIVAVPKGSQWRMPLHWHPSTTLGCVSVRCLSGRVRVFQGNDKGSGERSISPDSRAVRFQPAQMVAWASPGTVRHRKGCEEDWSFEMVVANPNLYRNMASAILDRNIYPSLSSTPLWIRIVFNVLRAVSRAREALLSWLLFIQVQAILYAHGFRESHGRINCIWPWTRQSLGGRPPEWARYLQRQSEYLIAKVVMASCFWFGRIGLGMKGEYPEYTRLAKQSVL